MNKESILTAAYELFLREGICDLHMHAIAEKLGVTKQELHACFTDKRDLVCQSVDHGLRLLNEALNAIESSSASPVEALVRMAVTAFDAFHAMSWNFTDDAPYCPAVIDAFEDERRRLESKLHMLFLQGVEQGFLLDEAYCEILERLFWQHFMTGDLPRANSLRVLFTVIRGSSTEKGWGETERIRQEMQLSY